MENGIEKGLCWDKFRLVKMSYLPCRKIGKTGKYQGNKKNRGALVPSNLNFIKRVSGLYKTRARLTLYTSETTAIFHPLAASGFFETTCLEWSCRWCSSARNFVNQQTFVISRVKIKDYTRIFIIWKSWNFKVA